MIGVADLELIRRAAIKQAHRNVALIGKNTSFDPRWLLPDGQESKTQDDSGLGAWLAHNEAMTRRTIH